MDTAHRHALQIAQQQAEAANRAKSLFIANISHDLRTPLTGLLGMTQILMQEIHSPRGQEAAIHLMNAGKILLKLLNEVIEFSQCTTGKLPITETEFSLSEIINEIVQLFLPAITEKKLKLSVDADACIPSRLRGDKTRLRRIMLDLLSNAVKFTRQGEIRIATRLVKCSAHTCRIKLAVEDTGIGIPLGQQSLIFEPFSRVSPAYEGCYAGAGLGLALVKQFISDLRGQITCTSWPGQGSVFTCLLPLRPVKPKRGIVTLVPMSKLESHPHWQILLVEDNPLVQMVTKNQLTALACEVDIAATGAQALMLASQKFYHLVFLDIGLPDINGYEVAHRIRGQDGLNQATAILALTAHVGAEEHQACLDAGMQRVLTKPLLPEQARAVLAEYAGKPHTAQPALAVMALS